KTSLHCPTARPPAVRIGSASPSNPRRRSVGRATPAQRTYGLTNYPAAAALVPADPDQAREVRLLDRLIDNYIRLPLQQIVSERLRPEGRRDPFGADRARGALRQGYDLVAPMIAGTWATGETFTLADCAALPALYYADYAVSLAGWPQLTAYLERLKARPSVARVLQEAQPYFNYFPLANDR
ncbi:MAG: glutathione S-transferase family protein, partial [Caulobacteraceae bacterium]